MEVADEIVDNPVLTKWYGTFPIGEHGVFTINRTKSQNAAEEKTITAKKTFRLQCILCPALRHGCLTLLYVTSIRDFFCPWNNRARLY